MEQTYRSQKGEECWGDWRRLSEEHMCLYARPIDTDNNMVKARVYGRGAGWKGAKEGGTAVPL